VRYTYAVTTLTFALPDGSEVSVVVRSVLNAGYAGRDQAQVRAHIDELAALGVPAPASTPALYPVADYLAQQTDVVQVQHGRTSGEAEWAVVVAGPDPDDVLLTAACDHTDRELEVHGVAWSKNCGPDVLARQAWRLSEVAGHLDRIELIGRVGAERAEIQRAPLAALLPPSFWLDRLAREIGTGTVILSGTVAMARGVDPFADRWEAELADPVTGRSIGLGYRVEQLSPAIG
jgi:hypothetical protein